MSILYLLLLATSIAQCNYQGNLIEEYLCSGHEIFTIEKDTTFLVFGTTSAKKSNKTVIKTVYFDVFIREITYSGQIINKLDIQEEGYDRLVDVKKTSDNGIVLLILKSEEFRPNYYTLVIKLDESMDIEWKYYIQGYPNKIFENPFGDFLVFWNSMNKEPNYVSMTRINSFGNEMSSHMIYTSKSVTPTYINSIDTLNSIFSVIVPNYKKYFYEHLGNNDNAIDCPGPTIKQFGGRWNTSMDEYNYNLYFVNEYGEVLMGSCFDFYGTTAYIHYNQKLDQYLAVGLSSSLDTTKVDFTKPFWNRWEAVEYTHLTSTINGNGIAESTMKSKVYMDDLPVLLNLTHLDNEEYLMFVKASQMDFYHRVIIQKYNIAGKVEEKLSVFPFEKNAHIRHLSAFKRSEDKIVIITTQNSIGKRFDDLYMHTISLNDLQ
jgi:hypothetical protein